MISRRTLVLAMLFAPAAGAAQSSAPIGEQALTFDERFKGDRAPVVEPCELHNACPVEPEIPTPAPRPKKAKKAERKRRHGDICRGRGRTYTKNGKSWRCNRS